MFDEIAPKNPNEPEDIFAGAPEPPAPLELKSALANKKLTPVGETRQPAGSFGSSAAAPRAGMSEIEISPPLLSKKSIFVVVGVILIIGLGAITAWGIFRASQKQPASNIPAVNIAVNEAPPAQVNQPTPEVNAPEVPAVPETPAAPTPVVDTDGDGLTDDEELKYGTDAQKIDTDEDTLSDYEEIMIWKTDPLNIDTDGDTFGDGTEVKNGYNPLGSGKLLELPAQ